jgi:N-methylhydantoinase B/oxoprolinase/acetone carboxylase alpha subunit
MNLLEEVSGKLPEDKDKMLEVVKKYQDLSESERLIYRIGRRGGIYSSTDDLNRDLSAFRRIEDLIKEVTEKEGSDGVEKLIADMVDQYI